MTTVRQMNASDLPAWATMRAALWPEATAEAHAREIEQILGSDDTWGFIAEMIDATPAGFAEVSIRKFANGCETQPVAFLEGIWVEPPLRRQRPAARRAHRGVRSGARLPRDRLGRAA